MSWIQLTLLSTVFLGFYDIAKKRSVHENAVPPVLFSSVSIAAFVYLFPIAIACVGWPIEFSNSSPLLNRPSDHLFLFGKSALVGASWVCAYFAIKHLPISIAMPIRTTSPIWTVVLAVTFTAEWPSGFQWLGVITILIGFLFFSRIGVREGIQFQTNRWIWLIIAATGFGAFSGLYDKFLLQEKQFSPLSVQAWFSIYLVPVMLPLFLHWLCFQQKETPFEWRWSIPMIALLLLLADFVYFKAIAENDAMISVISPLRRVSFVIPFLYGVTLLGEENWKSKTKAILIILCGATILSVSKSS